MKTEDLYYITRYFSSFWISKNEVFVSVSDGSIFFIGCNLDNEGVPYTFQTLVYLASLLYKELVLGERKEVINVDLWK